MRLRPHIEAPNNGQWTNGGGSLSLATKALVVGHQAGGVVLTGDLFSENDWKTGYSDATAHIASFPIGILSDSDTTTSGTDNGSQNAIAIQNYLQQRWTEWDYSGTPKMSIGVDPFDSNKRSLNFHSNTNARDGGTLKKSLGSSRRRIYMAWENSWDDLYDFNNNKFMRLVCRDGVNPFVDFYVSIGADAASGRQDCSFFKLCIQGNGVSQSGSRSGGDPNVIQVINGHTPSRATKYIYEVMLYVNSPGNADGEASGWWGPSGGAMTQMFALTGLTFAPNTGLQHYLTEGRVHMTDTNGAGYSDESTWRVHQVVFSTQRITGDV